MLGQVTDQPPPQGRLARLFRYADARHVPLRTILVTVAVVAGTYLAAQLIYRLRTLVLLIIVAGFVAVLLNPLVDLLPAPDPAPRLRRYRRHPAVPGGLRPWRSPSATRWSNGHPPGRALPSYVTSEDGTGWVGHLAPSITSRPRRRNGRS